MRDQINTNNVFFVTRENEKRIMPVVSKELSADQIQCEGCDRGEPVFYTPEDGHYHAAPEINGFKGRPFTCLKRARLGNETAIP